MAGITGSSFPCKPLIDRNAKTGSYLLESKLVGVGALSKSEAVQMAEDVVLSVFFVHFLGGSYLKSDFIIDLLGCMPWDIIYKLVFIVFTGEAWGYLGSRRCGPQPNSEF
ncbi:hypothetical protein CJ030_MR3G008340 [Morella rubra]|uniref:Uncharacterized protein n=1 Tax=Morella rubra TaxID=262757 RepID=A0A6A1W2S8_9ROSI|nr:hypothetical protein CJ030_MR3G008340 [Morella rubra]